MRRFRPESEDTGPACLSRRFGSVVKSSAGGLAFTKIGEKGSAEGAFTESMNHARNTKDLKRFVEASEQLADLVMGRDKLAAAKLLSEALTAADGANLKEERKGLRRKLDDLSS